jgi:hypothetical protein
VSRYIWTERVWLRFSTLGVPQLLHPCRRESWIDWIVF